MDDDSFGSDEEYRDLSLCDLDKEYKDVSLFNSEIYSVLQRARDYAWMVHFDSRVLYGYTSEEQDEENSLVVSCLFDTGALSANFISKKVFEKLQPYIKERDIIYKPSRVGLAGTSTVMSDRAVRLAVEFQDSDGNWQPYEGEFTVLEMAGNQIILGLPAIITSLWSFFIRNVEERSRRNSRLNCLHMISEGELQDPWPEGMMGESPEELDTPEPVQFEAVHAFLGKTREEALQDYYNLFETHVSAEFAAQTPVYDLLRGKATQVFVPEEWTGITGVGELELVVKDSFPEKYKPPTRYVNPRLYDAAEKEFNRLKGYFYEPSRSPWASPIVLAPKATEPFIRYCGDYSWFNPYIDVGHYTIPNVRHELDKIINYPIYLDIDLTNAFHQVKLAEKTRQYLSVQTPWGQYQPKFMPEGIGPGSGVLQETVRTLFADFSEWAIVIFDNVLILANDYQDAYNKLEIFIDRCILHNVKLKFKKSHLGLTAVDFFGYHCSHKSHSLTEDRKKAILEIPFPDKGNRQKKMRSALGVGVFCAPFVENYSEIVKNLTDCTKANFSWTESEWKHDYRQQFEEYKLGIQKAVSLFYPDYDLEWILRTDACDYGIGGILVQIYRREDGTYEYQTIALCSKKFSEQAQKWSTIEQEAYAMFYCVRKFAYYLRGKEFILETDHENLLWMAKSEVPKIIRWRIYMQSFHFMLRHIRGKDNEVADALSRLLLLEVIWDEDMDTAEVDTVLCSLLVTEDSNYESADQYLHAVFGRQSLRVRENKPKLPAAMTEREIFDSVHNAQAGHWGAAQTWKLMSKLAPGHCISQERVAEMVLECVTCQKTRKSRNSQLIPIVRHLKPTGSRTVIGVDNLTITPPGKNGMQYIIVVVNLFTKHTALYPSKETTAYNLAVAIWSYWCSFGHTDMIISDQGPDLTSKLMEELVSLMGMRHVFSIADRHVNGVERVIQEVSRHLRAIVFDRRVENVFDEPTQLPSVQYILNDHQSSETGGLTPFELTFGSDDIIYKDLLKDAKVEPSQPLLRRLNDNLRSIRAASLKYVKELVSKRSGTLRKHQLNKFQPGDYVLFDAGVRVVPKMATRLKGPFVVVKQIDNDVHVRNLVTDALFDFSLCDLTPFFGSKKDALEAARRDHNQHEVESVLSCKGNYEERYNLEFLVKFADGEIIELTYTPDLRCEALFSYCNQFRYLKHITMDVAMAKKWISSINKQNIMMKPGQTVFVDIRIFGGRYYESLDLPDWRQACYVMELQFSHWHGDAKFYSTGVATPDDKYQGSRKKIVGKYLLTGWTDVMTTYKVYCFAETTEFDPATMILVDDALAKVYPRLKSQY